MILSILLVVQLFCLALGSPAVVLSNVLSNANGAYQFTASFSPAVANVNYKYFQLVNTDTGAVISLFGATVTTSDGGSTWIVANTNGFYPSNPTAHLKFSFSNAPAAICSTNGVVPVSVTNPTTVVGNGSPSSCTEAALTSAIATGGIITFNCGTSPVTITVTSVKNVPLTVNTVIDGGNLVTISGGGTTRILAIQTTYDKLLPRVTLQNLALTNGYTTDVVNTTDTSHGGGALYRLGGAFTIINCDFSNNKGPTTGQDVAGGAIYSIGGDDTTIVGSTFLNNQCSNGGAIGNLGNDATIINSVINNNLASGQGGNPGNGGNAGGISFDGDNVYTHICGSTFSHNTGNTFGGALFRVGYGMQDVFNLSLSTLSYNYAGNQAGAIYVQDLKTYISNSTIMYNTASGSGGGIALQYADQYTLVGVTIANNTAVTSLGGGIAINTGSGTITDCTIVGNAATQAFAAGIVGGDTNTVLKTSIVAYSTEGNIYVGLSCYSTQMADGGGNYQWPAKRKDGNTDLLCSSSISLVDPLLGLVGDNGCTTWTAAPLPGSPAAGSGARCPAGSVSPPPLLFYSSGAMVPRGPFSVTWSPSGPTTAPTTAPTKAPTTAPTKAPTVAPTKAPTTAPTKAPTTAPTKAPTPAPGAPTPAPTTPPTKAPTTAPTKAPTNGPTTPPTTAPTKAPTSPPNPPYVVYSGQTGTIASGWNDFSWATHNLKDTTRVETGDTYAASMVVNGWQGLYFSGTFLLTPYTSLAFWINGGPTPSGIILTIQLVGANGNSNNLNLGSYTTLSSNWAWVSIPLTDFALPAANNNQITGFWIQGGGVTTSPSVYFDDIQFKP